MSNSTDTTGCISHRQNSRFFIIFEDFRDIARVASGTEHEHKLAAFWRVLETKTNDRITAIAEIAEECKKKDIPIPEEYLWIEMSYSDFVRRAQGVYKSSSFQIAAAESERLGFSKSRNMKRPVNPDEPDSPQEDYKEYLFFTDVMQTALSSGKLPPPIEINSPLLKAIPERKKKRKEKRAIEKNRESLLKSIAPPIEINTSPLLKSIGNNNIDKNITNDITNNERESPPNTLDTHTIVSSDTAHAEYPLITFADCLSYLQEQGVAPQGEDAVQVMVQARTLYAHKHPLQDEKVFTNDAPPGDDHATTVPGHPHRVGEPAAPGGASGHTAVDDGQVAAPEARPVLEAGQEIDKGDTHATRVPTLPRTDHPASLERDASGHPQSDNHCAISAADDLPVVHPVGCGTPGPQGSQDGKDTSPLTPAQSLSLPQDAQAALGARTKKAKPESPAPKCDTREIQRRINENRGYALEEDVEIIRERKAIKTWCNLHTLSDFDPVMKYLTTVDLYWRKPENRNRIGGLTLLKETSRVKSELEKGDRHRKSPNGIITVLPPNGRDLAARSRALREQYAGVRS